VPPRQPPTLHDDSIKTPAGRAFYGQDPADAGLRNFAPQVQPKAGYYMVDAHGSPGAFSVGADSLSASEMANLVRNDPAWNGRPVFLMSCETGQGNNPVAQQLANQLGVKVRAPTEFAWTDINGKPYSTAGTPDPSTGQYIETVPYNGIWKNFRPR
jgi:hypothetical protein